MTAQEVEALLNRARQWLKDNDEPSGFRGGTDHGELINDLVQLVESWGDKSIARTGEPLGERDSVDAARYRWLRDKSSDQYEHPICVAQQRTPINMRYVGPLLGKALDAAIDAAMGATDKGKL